MWPESSSLVMYVRKSEPHGSLFTLARCWFPEDIIGLGPPVFCLKELFQTFRVDFPLCISSYAVDLPNVYINFGTFLISKIAN